MILLQTPICYLEPEKTHIDSLSHFPAQQPPKSIVAVTTHYDAVYRQLLHVLRLVVSIDSSSIMCSSPFVCLPVYGINGQRLNNIALPNKSSQGYTRLLIKLRANVHDFFRRTRNNQRNFWMIYIYSSNFMIFGNYLKRR